MRRLILAAILLAAASPALAGQAVTLKADTVDADGIVTLGDLFEGAGSAAATPLATRNTANLTLSALAVQQAARRAGLDWANAEGFKSLVVHGPAQGAALAGAAAPTAARGAVEVLTYARSLAAGEIVQPEDLVWGKAVAAPADAPRDADAIIGLVAKRPLRAGAAVAQRDVAAAQVIKAGDTITVTFAADGISLSLQAKALSSGGAGETINVQNTSSKKIIQAVVTGPGQAAVGPNAADLKAPATRYAAR